MSIIKQILSDPEKIEDIIKTEVETSDWFERDYLAPQMLGYAIGTLRNLANNTNEVKQLLESIIETPKNEQKFVIGKALRLLS